MTWVLVVLTSRIHFLLGMQADEWQVLDCPKISRPQIGILWLSVPVWYNAYIISGFADNIGIGFHTPEEYFLKQAPRPFRRFEPTNYAANSEGILEISMSNPIC